MKYRQLLLPAALSALFVGGCASTSEIDEIRRIAEQAQADASAANQTAAEARAIAEDARRMSQETDERVNRLFRRSLQK